MSSSSPSARVVTLSAFQPTTTVEMPVVRQPPATARHRHPEHASTGCQCRAPEPCWEHPDDRPLVARKPAEFAPHPDSPVGRLVWRTEPGGTALEVECRERMAKHTVADLHRIIELAQAELARRGVYRAGGMQ